MGTDNVALDEPEAARAHFLPGTKAAEHLSVNRSACLLAFSGMAALTTACDASVYQRQWFGISAIHMLMQRKQTVCHCTLRVGSNVEMAELSQRFW